MNCIIFDTICPLCRTLHCYTILASWSYKALRVSTPWRRWPNPTWDPSRESSGNQLETSMGAGVTSGRFNSNREVMKSIHTIVASCWVMSCHSLESIERMCTIQHKIQVCISASGFQHVRTPAYIKFVRNKVRLYNSHLKGHSSCFKRVI